MNINNGSFSNRLLWCSFLHCRRSKRNPRDWGTHPCWQAEMKVDQLDLNSKFTQKMGSVKLNGNNGLEQSYNMPKSFSSLILKLRYIHLGSVTCFFLFLKIFPWTLIYYFLYCEEWDLFPYFMKLQLSITWSLLVQIHSHLKRRRAALLALFLCGSQFPLVLPKQIFRCPVSSW